MNEDDRLRAWRRTELKREMREDLERTIEERLDRYLEVDHQGVIPDHHFAAASSECLQVYRDGHLFSAAAVSQAITEGIWKFVLARNDLESGRDRTALAAVLVEKGIVSQDCADAFGRIFRSFRNDFHHMNPSIAEVPYKEIAQRNLIDLGTIEREIFGVTFDNGKIRPNHPRYWDPQPDGTMRVSLRRMWVGIPPEPKKEASKSAVQSGIGDEAKPTTPTIKGGT